MPHTPFVVPNVLRCLLHKEDGLCELDVVEAGVVLEVCVAQHNRLVRLLVLQVDQHGVLASFYAVVVREKLAGLAKVDQEAVNHKPFILLVSDSDRVLFFHQWNITSSTLSIDDIVADFLQFSVVEIVNMIHFLQADQTCLALSDFFHYARTAETEVQ